VEIKEDVHASVHGVGIVHPGNALRALDVIGCADACLEVGYSTAAWGRVLDECGEEIRQIPSARIVGSDLPPMNGLTRPQLHEILTRTAVEAGARIEYSKSFTVLEDGVDEVRVSFDDGTQGIYDVVVGADGIYSKVREYVCDKDVQPAYYGLVSSRCNIPRRIPGEGEIDRITVQEGSEGIAGYVPIAPYLAYIFYNTWWDRDERPTPNSLHTVLRTCLEPFGGITATVRDRYLTDPDAIVLRRQEWLIALPP
jgi:2-polyprenyl-6-methoxyphenol hydroxylase-like FAD-dependent oxidoreductase